MIVDLVNLPRNVLVNIFCRLDDKTILRLREVCKSSKNIVELSLLNSRKTEMKYMLVTHDGINIDETNLMFSFVSQRDLSIWKICIFPVKTEFEISGETGSYPFFVLKTRKVECFFNHFKPLIRNAKLQKLLIAHNDWAIFHLCFPIFEDKIIPKVALHSDNLNFNKCINFLQNVKATSFKTNACTLSKEYFEFLLKAADMMNEIKIYDIQEEIVMITKAILSRKCEKLYMRHCNALISSSDIENLIQYFHHLDKRVSFYSSTYAESMDTQIGVYKVKTNNRRWDIARRISIEHSNVKDEYDPET